MGIDEAGRGPVIGPMIVCGVVIEETNLSELFKRGVRDSKHLSPRRRKMLKREIELLADEYAWIAIPPHQIDKERINELELRSMVKLIARFCPQKVFLDAPTPNPKSYERRLRELLPHRIRVKLVVENFADENYPVVGAASILAKVERDRRIAQLERRYGSFGSGYPSDKRTIDFLRECFRRYGDFPPIVRRRWKTVERLRERWGKGLS